MMNSKLSSKPGMAVFQIAVLILGTFAFAYMFGGMVPSVSGQEDDEDISYNEAMRKVKNDVPGWSISAQGEYVYPTGIKSDITIISAILEGTVYQTESGKLEFESSPGRNTETYLEALKKMDRNGDKLITVQEAITARKAAQNAFKENNVIENQQEGVTGTGDEDTQQSPSDSTSTGSLTPDITPGAPTVGGDVAKGGTCNEEGRRVCSGGHAYVCDDAKVLSWVKVPCNQSESCYRGQCITSLEKFQTQSSFGGEADVSPERAPTDNPTGEDVSVNRDSPSTMQKFTTLRSRISSVTSLPGQAEQVKNLPQKVKNLFSGNEESGSGDETQNGGEPDQNGAGDDLGDQASSSSQDLKESDIRISEETLNTMDSENVNGYEDLDPFQKKEIKGSIINNNPNIDELSDKQAKAILNNNKKSDLQNYGFEQAGEEGPLSDPAESPKESEGSFVKKAFGSVGQFFDGVGTAYTSGDAGGAVLAHEYIFASASAALAGAQIYKWGASLLGAGERNLRSLQGAVFGTAAAAAGIAGAAQAGLIGSAGEGVGAAGLSSVIGTSSSAVIFGVGAIAAMGAYTLLSYQLYSQHTYEYQVSSWQPEFGGENCSKCNELRYGCSEYQCHTFGRACEIVNKGTQQERCAWKNEDDITPPVMSPMNSSLQNNQEYQPMDTEVPDDRGVQITNPSHPDGCLPAFSGAEIGVNTNELAECKVDIERRKSYENMTSYFSQGTSLVKNHTITIPGAAMPSESAGEGSGLEVENGEMNRYYAQCKDVNGNPSPNNLVVGFCVEEGPDTQPPVIEGTNYLNESFISNNQTTVPVEVYTNEPADCRWSRTNVGYSQMNNNFSQCSQNMQDYLIDSSFQYGCSGNVTGVKSGQENNYYIKCKDKPWLAGNQSTSDEKRIENKESFELTLEGTEPLVIRNITVNGRPNGTTIRDSTDSIRAMLRVETAGGAEGGNAKCSYTIDGGTFNFYNNGTTGFVDTNAQELYLSEGNYNVPVQCNDAGGNVAQSSVSFTIDEDNAQPQVTRTYRDEDNLRVLTSEGANCVYNTNPSLGCTYNFDNGVEMEQVDEQTHYVEWESNTRYYVKCADEFGNRPAPDQCSVTVRAYDL